MIAARLLFGALFACGFFFAAFTWILIPTPLGIFQPQYRYGIRDIVLSITGCGLAVTGYFVWTNWLWFAIRGKFFPGNGTGVQIVSFFNHLGWIALLPIYRQTSFLEFGESMPLVAAWILLNMVIALISALMLLSNPMNDEQRHPPKSQTVS